MRSRLLLLAAPLALGIGSPAVAAPAPDWIPAHVTQGTFRDWAEATPSVTYDPKTVPVGAKVRLAVGETREGSRVLLKVTGLVPGRAYGAHLHTRACTDDPADAGPHYQHRIDPAADAEHASVDPRYANPDNEVWLDFTADAQGIGRADRTQEWRFSDARPAWSMVLHAEHTHTAPGEAGTAGARLACMTRTAVRDPG
ncbi:superoxide dismutase [Actinoplanes sp. NPDC051861]|uniref:superoxide dismutase n=1 Tax=Actinoplanes sp. NPDC051861 TaxID=3155170 RepID=UPI0034245280